MKWPFLAYLFMALSWLGSIISLISGVFLVHSNEVFIHACGVLVIIFSLIALAATCLQGLVVYYSSIRSRR